MRRDVRGDFGKTGGRDYDVNDRVERGAIGRVLAGLVGCNQQWHGWVCTRAPGHDDDHCAANSRRIVARWRNNAPRRAKGGAHGE